MGRYKLKIHFMGVKNDQKLSNLGLRKSRRFVIFLPRFLSFWTENVAIGIYRKTGPTKSTVLGPRGGPGGRAEGVAGGGGVYGCGGGGMGGW
jgi:uncharacterized membrane protein YgcG